ncbi:hypothetical protein Glove_184g20 [Diversispora epigaea]|uniref:Uncharacterized protein n=1 Tax=Diversispora epigaea TaxID=1348612 RepID=A0A397IMD9_9GLOM|nr:hypothetical protein Glove_184g20 [Diversispora epigaea]
MIILLSYNTHEKLFSVRNLLQEEAIMAQNNVKTCVKHLSVFVKELNTSNRGPLCESFEEYVIQLHYTLQDKIDKGTICLFANKSDSKELFAALHNLEKLNLEFERLREIYVSYYYSKSH